MRKWNLLEAYLKGLEGSRKMAKKGIEVKLVKSLIGSKNYQKNCVRGLGLSKLGQVLMISDTPENRGMIKTAKHLLEVKEK